jgi:hypothetical protein
MHVHALATVAEDMMNYCGNCGHAAAEGAKFCVSCGKPLTPSASSEASSSPPPLPDAGVSESQTPPPIVTSSATSSSSKDNGKETLPGSAPSRRKIAYAAGIIVYWIAQGAVLLIVNAMNSPSGADAFDPSFLKKAAFEWLIGGFLTALIGRYVVGAIAADIKTSSIRKAFTATLIIAGVLSLATQGFSLLGFILSASMVLAFYAGLVIATTI